VGTFRAPLSLAALVRILTRLLGPRNEANDNEEFSAVWKSQATFCNTHNYAYGDVVLDNRALFTVVQVNPDKLLLFLKCNLKCEIDYYTFHTLFTSKYF
jgi:hypothetical protein